MMVKKNKYQFILKTIACVCVLVSTSAVAQSHNADSPDSTARFVVGPYLQAPAENSMTVMWLTDKKCTGWVEYGTEKDKLDQKGISTRGGLIDAYITTHKIKLTGLKPGVKYYYRVMSEEILEFGPYYDKKFSKPISSAVLEFTTCSKNKESVSVICFNDVHDNHKLLSDMLKTASATPYDAVFLNGDILDYIRNEEHVITNLLKPCADNFAKEVPFCYTRGNHETRGAFARHLRDYLDTPAGSGEDFYYAFTDGPVHFVILDGGEGKEDSHPVYANLNVFDDYRIKQAAWLKKHVETPEFKNAPWRIVMSHFPFETTATKYGVKSSVEKFTPHLNGRIDLNIAGHTHGFRIVEKSANQAFPIVVGGGPRKQGATIIRVTATKKEVNVSITNFAGEEIGAFQLKK